MVKDYKYEYQMNESVGLKLMFEINFDGGS